MFETEPKFLLACYIMFGHHSVGTDPGLIWNFSVRYDPVHL